ncbi:amidohydrolase family protein [Hymenobacter sp. BT186]|uniref:Amidohydrolase family protein n=1 Tax=Hymenobacter telluris TaxID=2816474 RepID=A0A939EYW4_9BACT|nr:amidohydrolase family protein [Hymenobacter telluris]MBO0359090.1 amidohydrolase family protein [Hymenobacter telluris]MBW3375116.1 amidohydrolase family protein [Hymenobacter norwichensis]
MKIDAHQHFWQYHPVRDAWINQEMAVIQRDFLPTDLQPLLTRNGLDGCVVVQSDQSEAENEFQLANAAQHSFIKGVVGWVDLQAENVTERLSYYRQFEKLKGFRHVLQGEANRALMLTPDFRRGIAALEPLNFTYDLLIFPDQLAYSQELVAAFPNQRFVLDHIAKPDIKAQQIEQWAADLEALAAHENVWCKVSGMVTEARWQAWQSCDFRPYLDTVFEAFGTSRVMFGSDWPVCEVAGGYDAVVQLAQEYLAGFSTHEQALFWGDTAAAFYSL